MSKELKLRNKLIVKAYNRLKKKRSRQNVDGYQTVGELFGLSKYRVRDIVKAYSDRG